MTLLEQYAQRLKIAEDFHKANHNGEGMSNLKKITTAQCLKNISSFMNESLANMGAGAATQRSDIGDYKKFTMNVTNLAVPDLIAYDLVAVKPMTAYTGYVTYMDYYAGTAMGGVTPGTKNADGTVTGTLFNGTYGLGNMDEHRASYTSSAVVEALKATDTTIEPAFGPVIGDKVQAHKVADNTWVEVTLTSGSATVVAGTYDKFKYTYNNVEIPQGKLPTIKGIRRGVALEAKARRIAVYYSQIAAFQEKNDYGTNFADQIAEQAQGELAYEIDSEVVALLADSAREVSALNFNTTLPVGVSMTEHFESFSRKIELAKANVYKATNKFTPNFMIVDASIISIISFIKGWNAAPLTKINGPYFAGTLNGVKVFVSPMLNNGEFIVGVNYGELNASAAVYAPYMPIVPTQLLGFADGGMSQGFSTMYDLKLLSQDANGKSPLLVKGIVTEG